MIEEGYAEHAVWDIVIEKVHNQKQALDFLYELNIGYIEQSVKHGVEQRSYTRFTHEQLKMQLQKFPVQLKLPNMYFIWQYIVSEKHKHNLVFSLRKNTGFENGRLFF